MLQKIRRDVIPGRSMDFQVLGRADAARAHLDVPHIVISVTEPNAPPAAIPETSSRLGILRLQFHDADSPQDGRLLMTRDQAQEILDLVSPFRHSARLIVCQCEGGISRSAGIAAALSRWLQGDDEAFFRYYQPNLHVYRTLLEQAGCTP